MPIHNAILERKDLKIPHLYMYNASFLYWVLNLRLLVFTVFLVPFLQCFSLQLFSYNRGKKTICSNSRFRACGKNSYTCGRYSYSCCNCHRFCTFTLRAIFPSFALETRAFKSQKGSVTGNLNVALVVGIYRHSIQLEIERTTGAYHIVQTPITSRLSAFGSISPIRSELGSR